MIEGVSVFIETESEQYRLSSWIQPWLKAKIHFLEFSFLSQYILNSSLIFGYQSYFDLSWISVTSHQKIPDQYKGDEQMKIRYREASCEVRKLRAITQERVQGPGMFVLRKRSLWEIGPCL